jgi:hypothetical protein
MITIPSFYSGKFMNWEFREHGTGQNGLLQEGLRTKNIP